MSWPQQTASNRLMIAALRRIVEARKASFTVGELGLATDTILADLERELIAEQAKPAGAAP